MFQNFHKSSQEIEKKHIYNNKVLRAKKHMYKKTQISFLLLLFFYSF